MLSNERGSNNVLIMVVQEGSNTNMVNTKIPVNTNTVSVSKPF